VRIFLRVFRILKFVLLHQKQNLKTQRPWRYRGEKPLLPPCYNSLFSHTRTFASTTAYLLLWS